MISNQISLFFGGFPLINFDLLSVGIAIAAIGLLGYEIYANNPTSITNRAFFIFSAITICWSIVNYINYQVAQPMLVLWLLRFVIFFGIWHAFSFFRFLYVFPANEKKFPRWYRLILVPWIFIVAGLTLSPFIFPSIAEISGGGLVSKTVVAWGIFPFALTVVALILSGSILFISKMLKTSSHERSAYKFILIGAMFTFSLLIIFNLILPGIFLNVRYIPLGALFILPFVVMTSYAIYRHHLFNLKVAATAFLGFMVTVFTFVNILYSTDMTAVVINVTAFAVVLIGSIRIVQDTLNLEKLTEELSETNERQEGLIHFIGHGVKGSLTKDAGAFAALVDGDFGQPQDEMKSFVERALAESRQAIDSVTTILTASNLKKGIVTHAREPFDLKQLVTAAVEKAKPVAERKGLTLTFTADESSYQMTGDKAQINDHVLRNLIDNAINYTLSGSINISLKKENAKIVFAVKDTGVGITEEDKKRLFTEGGHGKDSQTVNVHSTGYGLYIAKSIVEAHGGTLRAESGGAGRGSTFVVEFPV
ncbi:MAG: sensor histidine kinase [Minisyncoccota bacterium]